MRNFIIFHLRVCLMFFLNARFSNAVLLEIPNLRQAFKLTASIDTLFVKRPNDRDFAMHSSAKPMFLGVHNDESTLSFYERDAPHSFFSFTWEDVDFESFNSQSMAFSVIDENDDLWRFRCIFSASKKKLDLLYPYLSVASVTGVTHYRGDIMRVQQYIRMGSTRGPIVRNLEDLKPAMCEENSVLEGAPNEKIFSITPKREEDAEEPQPPRLVFRTNKFRVGRSNDRVVLNLSGFENWFYILYFENMDEAVNFVTHISITNSENFDIPSDLQSFLETAV